MLLMHMFMLVFLTFIMIFFLMIVLLLMMLSLCMGVRSATVIVTAAHIYNIKIRGAN